MKKQKLHNRILSGALAAFLLAGSCFVPQNIAYAADYYIRFFDTTSKVESSNIQMVEGTSINILANLPPNYTISADTPFAVRKSGSNVDAAGNFNITKNTNKSYTLIAKPNSAGTSVQEYTLEAIYAAIIFSGTGSGHYVDASNPSVVNDYVLEVSTEAAGLAMTEDSSFTFVAAGDESADGIFGIEKITDATGAFSNYNNSVPTPAKVVSEGGKRTFKLQANSTEPNPKPLSLTVQITGPTPVKKGTKFKIDFRRQTINSLIATVITEDRLRADTVDSVINNPVFPGATDAGIPYIKLEPGETLDSIRSSFEVLAKFHRFNVDVGLEWAWEAENSEYNSYVELKAGTLGKAVFDILRRPLEDMKGKLKVWATYNGTKSPSPGEIPVIIYGTGTPATFTPVTQTTGDPPNADKTEVIAEIPAKMDVYDGKDYNANFYTDKPKAPYTFSSSISFGTGRGIASYATITNESQGGEFNVHIDGDSNEYKLGDKIENIGRSKSIEIIASKEGQCSLVVKFFNSFGDEMAKNRITKQMRIYDTSPQRDARLQALDLELVANTSDDQKVLNSVYKNGNLDFSFDKDKNVYEITVPYKAESVKLRPRIPAATDAKKVVNLIYDGRTERVDSGNFSTPIALTPLVPKRVIVEVTSQAGTTNEYTLLITRGEQSHDSQLKSLEVTRVKGAVGNLIEGFSPSVLSYDVSVPYNIEKVKLDVTPQSPWISGLKIEPEPTTFRFLWWEWATKEIELNYDVNADGEVINNITTIKITVTAEDTNTKTIYTVNVTREAPSDDATLASLSVTDKLGKVYPFKDNQRFDPNQHNYFVEIPYTTQSVEIKALHNHEHIKKMTLTPPPTYDLSKPPPFDRFKPGVESVFREVNTAQDKTNPLPERNTFTYELVITPENGNDKALPYYITFVRQPASSDNSLSALKVFDEKGKEIPFNEGQTFTPEIRDYYINIPYSAKTINIEATNRQNMAQKITLTEPDVFGGNVKDEVLKEGVLEPIRFASLDVAQNMSSPDKNKNAFEYELTVMAENAEITRPAYIIHVVRSDPDADTRLESLEVTDQDKNPVDTFAFNQEQLEYTVNVPYSVTRVTIAPKAFSPGALVVNDDIEMTPTRSSVTIELISGRERVVKIEVTSESAEKRVYVLKFMRGAPSSEARLSALVADTLAFSPKFNPSTLKYSLTIPEGTKGYTVTPTAHSEFATITVNGKPVKSGEKSGAIRPIDPLTSTIIEVTAQDGRTKLIYTLNVRDENLVERSSNADLNAVSITNAALTPYFKAAIEAYDVAIAPETSSVDIKPKPADENAVIKVFDGTRELESYNGVYSTGIREEETKIKIEVTSQDKTKVKNYDFTIYKDNEEKAGIFKPITTDMVNWEQNPIYVDVSKYSVVSAEVFNMLKTEHPDKTMVFEGNDYSLTINGKDIVTLVPNTDVFDLGITYNGPNNDKVKALINALDARNAPLVPVVVHFKHHGTLPGPMQFQLSLGGFYKNMRMYWNYFNEERNRIDYYGYFKTNAQGTFSVPITHMSSFVATTGFVYGSENKVGFAGGGENIGGATGSKPNPSTGGKSN